MHDWGILQVKSMRLPKGELLAQAEIKVKFKIVI